MAGVIPASGQTIILNAVKALTLTLRLFTNNATPSTTTVAGDLVEAGGDGYSAIALSGATLSGSNPTTATYPLQTFTFTGALGNVYGYYITDGSGTLLGAERFSDAPNNIVRNGDKIEVTPALQV